MANPGLISIDYAGAMEKVQKARGYKASHDEVIVNLKTLMSSLNDVWTGNRSTQLANEFASFETTFKNFSQLLEDYANKMEAWANGFKEYDDSASAN